jgi:hypothetical protein
VIGAVPTQKLRGWVKVKPNKSPIRIKQPSS